MAVVLNPNIVPNELMWLWDPVKKTFLLGPNGQPVMSMAWVLFLSNLVERAGGASGDIINNITNIGTLEEGSSVGGVYQQLNDLSQVVHTMSNKPDVSVQIIADELKKITDILIMAMSNNSQSLQEIEHVKQQLALISHSTIYQYVDDKITNAMVLADVKGNNTQQIIDIVNHIAGQTTLVFPFSYDEVSPKHLFTIDPNKLVFETQLILVTGLNGSNPTLSIGDSGDDQRLMAETQNIASEPGQYFSTPGLKYNNTTAINLYITPGGGGFEGAGYVVVRYQT